LFIAGNHKPQLRTVDDAWRRRLHIVPFLHKPTKCDSTLKDRLRPEYGQILQWAINGCIDWQQNGLVVPQCIHDESNNYFESQDGFGEWLEECTTPINRATSNASLYADYKVFCDQRNEKPLGTKGFGDELVTRGFRRVKCSDGIRVRGHYGIGLIPG
jgi:putative DNA primase/helicase